MCDNRGFVLFNFKFVLFVGFISKISCQLIDSEFIPQVSATCKAGHINIRVAFNSSFVGAVHARDYRNRECMVQGDGSNNVNLDINMLAQPGSSEYCGIVVNNKTDERSLPVAVRIHKTLELADDKLYVITCGKAGFRNSRNETSLVSLALYDGTRRITQAVYGKPYVLKAEISRPDENHGFRIKSCMGFNKFNTSVLLVDDKGCPVNSDVLTPFAYDHQKGLATSTIRSMFKFPEGSEVHFQCEVGLCRGKCVEPICGDVSSYFNIDPEEGNLLASTSVFVLDPGEAPLAEELCDTDGIHPSWLLWLTITLGVLFLIMFIINIFLCTAMTCACTRTEIIDKDPSIIEDYDPYRSWHGSQYGSRYSLNGPAQHPKAYTSGGSTMNSTRSISSHSDHYAIVHSRPNSRYKVRGEPGSHVGSHYSTHK